MAALAFALAGCQLGPRLLADPSARPDGEWAVVGVRAGPVGVRDPAEVMARYGHVIRYEMGYAASGAERCTAPLYIAHAIVADRFLHGEFGVRAADLGLHPFQDLRVTEVFCNRRKWRALGGDAFFIDHDRGYAVRDDVLYELRRTKPAGAR